LIKVTIKQSTLKVLKHGTEVSLIAV
jgi:hypothetical protein